MKFRSIFTKFVAVGILSPICFTGAFAQTDSNSMSTPNASPAVNTASLQDIRIVMHTDKGDIEMKLFPSKAPVTVASFLNLAKKGFYQGLTFHRVIPGFMAQGGDPTGTGAGGPGYKFEDEIHPSLQFTKAGLLAMANAGPGTNGSQFFITHAETPWLNGHHTIFGEVTKGQDVVTALQRGDHIKSIDILDSTAPLFKAEESKISQWDSALKKDNK